MQEILNDKQMRDGGFTKTRESKTWRDFLFRAPKIKTRESKALNDFIATKNRETGIGSPEKMRLSLGFDIFFVEEIVDGNKVVVAKIAEVNGHNSGNNGWKKILQTKENRFRLMFQRIRSQFVNGLTPDEEELIESFSGLWDKSVFGLIAYILSPVLYNEYLDVEASSDVERLRNFQKKIVKYKNVWTMSNPNNKIIVDLLFISTYEGYQLWRKKYSKQIPTEILYQMDEDLLFLAMEPSASGNSFINNMTVEYLLTDKTKTGMVIGEGNRIKSWEKGESCFSPTGYWIMKPKYGARQQGIQIIPSRKLLFYSIFYPKYKKFLGNYNIQVLHKTRKPDNAPVNMRCGNSYMRLRLDLIYRDDPDKSKRIQIVHGDTTFHVYNRFYRSNKPDFANFKLDGFDKAYEPSKVELDLAMEAAFATIHNLVEKAEELENKKEN